MGYLIYGRRFSNGTDVLPKEYTILDYVENISTSFIRTGYIINNNDIIEIDFTPSAYTGIKFICGGSNVSVGVNNFFLATTLQQWQYRPSSSFQFKAGKRYNVRFGSGLLEVNGQALSMNKGTISNTTFSLFSDNGADSRRFLGKIHAVNVKGKISFIPCKNSENIIGFYNLYDKLFLKSNSTPFNGG